MARQPLQVAPRKLCGKCRKISGQQTANSLQQGSSISALTLSDSNGETQVLFGSIRSRATLRITIRIQCRLVSCAVAPRALCPRPSLQC
jgi:hypothetical protein